MTPTRHYVRAATRGLWGKRRRELQTELNGHIAVRIHELRLAGLSGAEAEQQTLRELGAPGEVRTGMLSVHTLPALGKGSLAAIMAATLLIGTLPHSSAQINGLFSSSPRYLPTAYVNLQQLQTEIIQSGGTLTRTAKGIAVTFPGMPRADIPNWPGITLDQQGHTFIQTDAVLLSLYSAGADLRLTGWSDPVVHVGSTKIRIQTKDGRIANSLYRNTLITRPELTRNMEIAVDVPGRELAPVTLKGDFQAGQVYAFVGPIFQLWSNGPQSTGNMELVITTALARQGQVTFQLPAGVKTFRLSPSVDSMHQVVQPYLDAGAMQSWELDRPPPAVLLALSGHFGPDAYTVVSPQRVQR